MSRPTPADLEQLIADFEASGLRELHVRHEGFELYLSKDGSASGLDGAAVELRQAEPRPNAVAAADPARQPAPVTSPTPAPAEWPANAVIVQAPYLGTFYRSPQPGSPSFVEEGDPVTPGQTLCILEAMKLMNEVKAEVEAVVRKFHVGNAEPVEYGQLLIELEPLNGRPTRV